MPLHLWRGLMFLQMVSVYSRHGKHKRIAKFRGWWKASEWLVNRSGIKEEDYDNYFFRTTKS